MTILGSRNWRATEGTDFSGNDRKLVVTGEVEMSQTNLVPQLDEAVPQGTNPSILLLDLTQKQLGDVGGAATTWEPVTFEKPVSEGEYTQVEIAGQTTIDVEIVLS